MIYCKVIAIVASETGDDQRLRLLAQMRETPAARNGLLLPEHLAFCGAWSEKVNPDANPFKLLYCGGGPDFVTPLFTFNPTSITIVDPFGVNPIQLKEYLAHPDKLLDFSMFPLSKTEILRNISIEPGDAFAVNRWALSSLMQRGRFGYWNQYYQIGVFGIERCIVWEMMKLGVSMKEVEVGQNSDDPAHVEIRFPWQHVYGSTRERAISFIKLKIQGHVEADSAGYDGYYQKAMNDDYWYYLKCANKMIRQGGVALVGINYPSASRIKEVGAEWLRLITPRKLRPPELGAYQPLRIHHSFYQMVRMAISGQSPDMPVHYPWCVKGYQKSA